MTVSIEDRPATTYRPDEVLHELRGTVAGIAAATRVLRQQRPDEGPAERRLGEMLESEIARLDLLLGVGAPGGMSGRPAVAELSAVIGEVVLCHRIRGLDVHWTSHRCGVVARQWDVREALHILLDNAARHAAGSDVTVTARRRGGGVEIAVTDSGAGVPSGLAERVFERGFRQDGSPGQGLGLHLARRLAVGFGGVLGLDASYAAGARFVLWVPVRQRVRRPS